MFNKIVVKKKEKVKVMKSRLKKLIGKVLPLRNSIVFESNPEFGCNTLPVYNELVKRGIRKKYQIYWLVKNKAIYKGEKHGIKYINYEEKGFAKVRRAYILCTSKLLIFSNVFLKKHKKSQLVINLMHGSPLKIPIGYWEGDNCDFVITQAKFFNSKISEILGVPESKMIALGYPRTDVLKNRGDTKTKLNIPCCNKVIVWMPTFRKNASSGIEYCDVSKLGVPLLQSKQDFSNLNRTLQENKVVLLIKLHPAEDVKGMILKNYSNICFVNDNKLKEKNIFVYQVLADSDALITDYSSVYYDYLLVDRPIGLVINDIEEFEKKGKFAYGRYTDFVKGTYIYTLFDLERFIIDLNMGRDISRDKRHQAFKKYCQYTDFCSTKRVCDFIEKNINEKFEK